MAKAYPGDRIGDPLYYVKFAGTAYKQPGYKLQTAGAPVTTRKKLAQE
jgi:hypothetical protein